MYIDRDYIYFSYFLKLLYSFSKSSNIENLNSAMLEKSLWKDHRWLTR